MSKMRGQKRQLEKARQERAAAKRDRRQGRGESTGPDDASEATDVAPEALPEDVVLGRLAELHQRYADGGMELDEFEAARAELVAQLRVD